MNHILKKLQIAGAKKQQSPKPPIYKPPEMGELQYGTSHSYAETLDLISDGPIAGVVNSHGDLTEGLNILQGVYLNDTPVAIAADGSSLGRLEAEAAEEYSKSLDNGSDTGIKSLINFCKALEQQSQPLITNLDFQGGVGTNPHSYEKTLGGSANLFFISFRDRTRYPDVPPPGMLDAAIYFRAFIKYADPDGDQTFYTWFDADLSDPQPITGQHDTLFSATNAAYRNIAYPCGVAEPWDHSAAFNREQGHGPKSLFWTDAATLADSKFLTAYAPPYRAGEGDTEFWGLFRESVDHAQTFIQSELDAILELWNNSREGNGNQYQKILAERALNNIGWTEDSDITTLLKDHAGAMLGSKKFSALMIAKINEVENSELVGSILDGDDNVSNWGILPYSTESVRVTVGSQEFFTNYGTYHQLERNASDWWSSNPGYSVKDVSCPVVGEDGELTEEMRGFIIFIFRPHARDKDHSVTKDYVRAWPDKVIKELGLIDSLRYTKNPTSNVTEIVDRLQSGEQQFLSGGLTPQPTSSFYSQKANKLKFNYTNVLAEIKRGEEEQEPFTNFRRIFIDHIYNVELFGPFRTAQAQGTHDTDTPNEQEFAPQRITQNTDLLNREAVLNQSSTNFNLTMADGLPINEGSDDRRKSADDIKSYSSWGKNSLAHWDEKAISVTHTVYNPNVTSAFITLNIASLHDSLVNNVDDVIIDNEGNDKNLEAGTKFPAVVNIRVETGAITERKNENGTNEKPFQSYNFRIVALIEGQTLVDIGNPDNSGEASDRDYIVSLDSSDARTSLNVPFNLPLTTQQGWRRWLGVDNASAAIVGNTDQLDEGKRYIKITKLSFETNSVLISKIINVAKVTEIIESDIRYPFSAIVGTKLDSRSFGSIPERSFDCKLKLVRIPNNYFPEGINGRDKRYYKNTQEFDDTPQENKLVYQGDWDGTFHSSLGWTDNPAWILYDLLTNNRYGMGSHIDADKINKWQLYKIGRFCDAVNDNGYFEGVTDGHGGLEPRFSCNVVFQQGQKIYDAINTIAGLFKGRVFFGNSEINFVDDRPRSPTNLFTNESVKDGQFFYSNNRRDEQFNTIEVSFKDRFDNFVPKIEVIEDEEDIRERGIFKTRIEGVGITSRAMARRVGQHKIFSSINENQTVAFAAGLESLLCQPGDLVTIEDELKTNKANFGKILAVDPTNETIRLSNSVDTDNVNTGSLTVYNPTGRDTIEDINELLDIKRERYEGFTITGFGAPPTWVRYTGDYAFSGYTAGYNVSQEDETSLYQEYGLYTGVSGTFLYFETAVTGWTFASGTGVGNVGAFDLASGDFIAESTGAQSLIQFNTGKISAWDVTQPDHRGAATTFSGFGGFGELYDGVLNSEISAISPNQMNVLSVTGYVWATAPELELRGFNPYGTVLSGFDKPQLLPFLKLGSPAKFEIKDASPFIYKVISMKEDAPNEYLVTATKYDTGKFNLIEKDISIENEANTYSYQVAQTINGITYSTLAAPVLDIVTTGEPDAATDTFSITGMWSEVSDGTGYNVRLTQPNGSVISEFVTTTGHEIPNLGQVGVFNFCVNALGNKGGGGNVNCFFDSSYDCAGRFVVYDELLLFNRAFVNTVRIMEL